MRKFTNYFCLLALAVCVASNSQAATVYCNQVGGYYPGIYSFPTEGGKLDKIYEYSGLDSKYGGVFTDEAYYSTFSSTYSKYCVRALHDGLFANWQYPSRINEKLKITDIPTALGWNSITGKIYGSFINDDETGYFFGTFSETDGTSTKIADIQKQLVSIIANEFGQMFAIDVDGDLMTISPDGVSSIIGNTGVLPSPKYAAGAAFDIDTNKLYWAVTTKQLDCFLYTVDIETGIATEVYAFPSNTNITSLIIPSAPAPEEAPANVVDFVAIPVGFENKLDISFTLPSKTIAGEDMLGGVNYKVMVDAMVIAEDMKGPGQKISLTCAPGNGEHVVTLFISNKDGKGNKCVAKTYVGEDSPGAVIGLEITVDGKTITLDWNAPVVGQHGGNFDDAGIRYDVVRDNDGQTVAQLIGETTFSETIESDQLAKYSYTVTPVCGELRGVPMSTVSVLVGDGMKPPYEQTFDTEDSFDEIYFTTYDANDDGKGWTFYQNYYGTAGNARYKYSTENDADDWLITCPLVLESGFKYEISFVLDCSKWGNGERLGVYYGAKPVVDDMTETVLADTDYEKGFNGTVEASVEPAVSGTYYLGFHITSAKNGYDVNLDNIKIEAGKHASLQSVDGKKVGVYGGKGEVIVSGDDIDELRIYDMNGSVMACSKPYSGYSRISVNSGIYVVKVGCQSYKVIVK